MILTYGAGAAVVHLSSREPQPAGLVDLNRLPNQPIRERRGRDVLDLLDGWAASFLLERKVKRVHAAAAFLRIPQRTWARLLFV